MTSVLLRWLCTVSRLDVHSRWDARTLARASRMRALRRITGLPRQPVRGVDRAMLRTQPRDVVVKPRDRPPSSRPAWRSPWLACPDAQPGPARISGSNGVKAVGTVARSYLAAGPRPNRARPSAYRSQDPGRPDVVEHRPRPAAGSEPNPPLRSPIQSVWVALFSTVAVAPFSNVVDKGDVGSDQEG